MELTGKAKDKFEEWFTKDVEGFENYDKHLLNKFYRVGFSMQYGVYVDFFDSVGLYIDKLCPDSFEINWGFDWYSDYSEVNRTRPEARTKAIEKANELLNERL